MSLDASPVFNAVFTRSSGMTTGGVIGGGFCSCWFELLPLPPPPPQATKPRARLSVSKGVLNAIAFFSMINFPIKYKKVTLNNVFFMHFYYKHKNE